MTLRIDFTNMMGDVVDGGIAAADWASAGGAFRDAHAISFFFDHTRSEGAGSEVSSIVLRDHPQEADSLGGAFPYRAEARHNTWEDGENAIWDVSVRQRMTVI